MTSANPLPGDDRPLVDRFLRGRDETSFRALYRLHTPALFLLALRLVGNVPADAEDAVQEAWMRAVRSLERFRWESSLRTWLSGITINCCREVLRRRRFGNAPEPSDCPSRPWPASALGIEALLRALPDGYREVLLLHDLEGYTHEEISRLLDISSGTSKSQLSRARKTLRAWLNAAPSSTPKEEL